MKFLNIGHKKFTIDIFWILLLFVDLDLNGDGIAHDDILNELRFIYFGEGQISYRIPLGPLYQAGVYNFTVRIQEETSIFTGSASVLIDLVERTSLSIEYDILEERAEGKHYIWEPENITFTLRDEDGDPLPDYSQYHINETVNRLIRYKITNGKVDQGSHLVDLEHGKHTITHVPAAYGFETCTVTYGGSRFFTPADARDKVEIFRRPLIFRFLDFHHDNPARKNLPHTGHRGETVYITAQVQDYLNLSTQMEGHEVYFGYDGTYLDIHNTTNENGTTVLEVPLTAANGLTQAGKYGLHLRIHQTEKYQPIEASHPEELVIFENCSVKFETYDFDISNYLYKPTVLFIDEDNQTIRSTEFYLTVRNLDTGQIVYNDHYKSGKIPLSLNQGGRYKLSFAIGSLESAFAGNISVIAGGYVNQTQFLAKDENISFKVFDPIIPNCPIFFLGDLIQKAFLKGVNRKAGAISVFILFLLTLLFGPESSKRMTFGGLMKFLFIVLVFEFLGYKPGVVISALFYVIFKIKFVKDLRGGFFLNLLTSVLQKHLRMSDWLLFTIDLALGPVVGGFLLVKWLIEETKENLWEALKDEIKIAGIEVILLFFLVIVDFFKNKVFKDNDLIRYTLRRVIDFITAIWYSIHYYFENKKNEKLGYLIILLGIIFTISGLAAEFIAYILIPENETLEWYLAPIRRFIRLSLKYTFISVLTYILYKYVSAITIITKELCKSLAEKILETIVLQAVISFVTSSMHFTKIPQEY